MQLIEMLWQLEDLLNLQLVFYTLSTFTPQIELALILNNENETKH